MNNTFDSFYFLHIRKTGGRFYIHAYLNQIKETIIKENIKYLDDRVGLSDHSQWRDDINNSTYITSIIRDPVEHVISFYSHKTLLDDGGRVPKQKQQELTKKEFFDWYTEKQNLLRNYQSKNFINSTIMGTEKINPYQNNEINKKDLLDRINQVALLVKSTTLTNENIPIIQNKILDDLGIKDKYIDPKKVIQSDFENPYSKNLYNSLTNKEKEYIRSISDIDSEIYETETLFWNV